MARNETDAALLGIAFLGVKDIYSADNSSPQTTEINAQHRVATLMKWVNIAAAESIGVILILTAAAPRGHKRWPFFGGMLALVVTYAQYLYAKSCGVKSNAPPTENFSAPLKGRPRG
jgi:hypothetical protein